MKKTTLTALCCLLLLLATRAQQTIPAYLDDALPLEQRVEDALARLTIDEKVAMVHAQSKFSAPGVPRLGIPELWMSDGPHGVRAEIAWNSWAQAGWTNDSCTAFPALTCLAATFNPSLALEYGDALGQEARYRRKDVILGPGLNIYRVPLNGRNFEYMGEDPHLASVMVVPYVQGVQRNGVAACLKHFALNNQETRRSDIDVQADDRALREIYLPAFHAGVREGGAWAVMGSYNKFRGQHCTHHHLLVNDILKGEWGFDGILVSDWGSTHDTRQAALDGLDVEMGTSAPYADYHLARPYLQMLLDGQLPVTSLDDKVRRILRLHLRTTMNRNRPWGALATAEHADVARRVAEQGIVLLKNDGILPLAPGIKIAVIGENATRSLTTGGGSSELKVKRETSPLEALRALYGPANVTHSAGYASGRPAYERENPSPLPADSLRAAAVALARDADAVLFFGGLNKNHRQDSEGADRLSYNLPFGQDTLIAALLAANRRTVIIIVSGNAVAMPWLPRARGVIQSWYLGSEAGGAIAGVISGNVNPSGKLPFSIPARLEDNGAISFGAESYPGRDGRQQYLEGILVGYRWHDTRGIPALFPFGHGLSYTTFRYGKATTDKREYACGDTIRLSLPLANTGRVAGAETVQVYVSQRAPSLPRPVKELKGFCKITLLPGERSTATIAIPVNSLAFFDDRSSAWLVEPDDFTLHCASSSTDVRGSVTIRVR
ncbi:MAG: glycoside hydrolase family 3 C-terminal domain-containing protein [Odoribacteraceae bacterium]|jgi:beta-glucosidase|nr:glycoside hydrolase family 3 C-terminal domain-containing protein [Odoribacteraceae bacterium]